MRGNFFIQKTRALETESDSRLWSLGSLPKSKSGVPIDVQLTAIDVISKEHYGGY